MGFESPPDFFGVPTGGAGAQLRQTELQKAVRGRTLAIHRDGGFRNAIADIRLRGESKDAAQPGVRQARGAAEARPRFPDTGRQSRESPPPEPGGSASAGERRDRRRRAGSGFERGGAAIPRPPCTICRKMADESQVLMPAGVRDARKLRSRRLAATAMERPPVPSSAINFPRAGAVSVIGPPTLGDGSTTRPAPSDCVFPTGGALRSQRVRG